MTQEELSIIFDTHKGMFDSFENNVENKISKREYYKGPFYEITPFSFQRVGFKQGKIIKDINKIKSTKGLYIYGFDKENNLIEVKEGISIPEQFYYQFLLYEKDYTKSVFFNNTKELLNVSFFIFDNNKRITKVYSKGTMGGGEEEYIYDDSNKLVKIIKKQFNKKCIQGGTLIHTFEYDDNKMLKSILKSPLDNNYCETIWSR